MDGQEMVRKPVPEHHTGGEGQQVLLLCRILPGGGASLAHVGLIEEERDERHIPGGTGLEAVQDVLVGVPCERTPIVPGHSEGQTFWHSCQTPSKDDPFLRDRLFGLCGSDAAVRAPVGHSGFGMPAAFDEASRFDDGALHQSGSGQTRRRPISPKAAPIAAPPSTSEAWWARRWSRLTPTSAALVNKSALPARSWRWLMTVAAQNAARVWPLGKLLVVGSRTGMPPWVSCSPARSGRERPTTDLSVRLTMLDSTPAMANARTARARSGPLCRARQTVVAVHISPWSPRPVMSLARPSSDGAPRSGSNQRSTRSSKACTTPANPPGRPASLSHPDRRAGPSWPGWSRPGSSRTRIAGEATSSSVMQHHRRWLPTPPTPGPGHRRRRGRSPGSGSSCTRRRSGVGSPRRGTPVRWPTRRPWS